MNKKSFTMADRRSSRFHISNIQRKAVAFTMAEILLSLTIIGVVAAITLPSLTGNINERTWDTQRKTLYARMSQAIALMDSLNGYGVSATEEQTNSNAAKAFITSGLSKVLKINNICDYEHLGDCNIPLNIKDANNSTIAMPTKMWELNTKLAWSYPYNIQNTYATAFETVNGNSVLVFYNPYCVSKEVQHPMLNSVNERGYMARQHICLNFIFDTNGKKGPNTTGKDIGVITALYSTNSSVIMAMPYGNRSATKAQFDAINYCKNKGTHLPNLDEAISVWSTIHLYGLDDYSDAINWTSTTDASNGSNAMAVGGGYCTVYSRNKTTNNYYTGAACVK